MDNFVDTFLDAAAPDIGQLEMRPVAQLKPLEKNPRRHGEDSIAAIMASIREFGFRNPLLVDGNRIIAGNGRHEAAKRLGMREVPTLAIRGLSPEQIRAYIMADNATAERSTWDVDVLRFELGELQELEFDISTIGFSDDYLANLLADRTEGLTDPDDVPEVPEEPVSRTGDLWILGRHRLLCGDSTVAADVERLLGGVRPHLMVTDPPYGVEYDPDWRNRADRANGKPYGASAVGKPQNDDTIDWREAWALFPGEVAYCWHAGLHASAVQASLETAGFEIRCQIVWAKHRFVISRGHYHWQHEPCWYAVKKGSAGHWAGDRSQTTLWQIDTPLKSDTGHSTQKPVECMRRPVENNSSPGQAVYDPFIGSGTTVIAAEQTGRSCLCLEISPAYVDVTVKRWQDFTGQQAVLDGDGRGFDEIAAERASADRTVAA